MPAISPARARATTATKKAEAELKRFNASLRKASKNFVRDELNKFVKEQALEFLDGVVSMAPVKTGHFRHGWHVTIGKPGTFKPAKGTRSSEGAVLGRGRKELARLHDAMRQIVWVTNNVVYGPALEAGHSSKAPAGTVTVTLQRLRRNLALR